MPQRHGHYSHICAFVTVPEGFSIALKLVNYQTCDIMYSGGFILFPFTSAPCSPPGSYSTDMSITLFSFKNNPISLSIQCFCATNGDVHTLKSIRGQKRLRRSFVASLAFSVFHLKKTTHPSYSICPCWCLQTFLVRKCSSSQRKVLCLRVTADRSASSVKECFICEEDSSEYQTSWVSECHPSAATQTLTHT